MVVNKKDRIMRSKTIQTIESSEKKWGLLFLLPSSVFMLIFLFGPIGYAIYMSLFKWKLFDLGRHKEFIGLDNFIRAFSDKLFLSAAGHTLTIVVVCLFFQLVLGFIIALALWNIQRALKIVHAIILLPMITSPVIIALIWRFIYDPQFGIFNWVLKSTLGIKSIAWLGDISTALPSIMLVDIWQMTSFVILIFYAGLTTISTECIESAYVDGASFIKTVYYIIIPFMLPTIFLVIILRTMDLFKIFDTIFLLTRGGPGSASESLSTYIYKASFIFYDMGYAMALSLIALMCIIFVSIGYLKVKNAKE
jgi:multiple sugar transport system permease protein